MEQKWKPIKEYEGFYEVSNDGKIRGISRSRWTGKKSNTNAKVREKIISIQKSKIGYCKVRLWKYGKTKYYLVHRLVAKSFILNKKNFLFINHKNGIKSDNRVGNLEWCNKSYNLQHAYDTGLRKRGSKHYNSKLKEKDVKIIKYGNIKLSHSKIAKLFGVSRETIRDIINQKKWKWI